MYEIAFVCHGNICRSPMAEYVMKDIVQKAGRAEEFFIASFAVSTEEIWGGCGNPVYPPVKNLLRKKGIDCTGKRATLLTETDGEKYDYFLCMDDSNIRRARAIVGAKNAGKCVKLLSFAGESRDVADPWYTGDFQKTYDDVCKGVAAFMNFLDER